MIPKPICNSTMTPEARRATPETSDPAEISIAPVVSSAPGSRAATPGTSRSAGCPPDSGPGSANASRVTVWATENGIANASRGVVFSVSMMLSCTTTPRTR